jgi:hypothetical protein
MIYINSLITLNGYGVRVIRVYQDVIFYDSREIIANIVWNIIKCKYSNSNIDNDKDKF